MSCSQGITKELSYVQCSISTLNCLPFYCKVDYVGVTAGVTALVLLALLGLTAGAFTLPLMGERWCTKDWM